MPPTLHPPQQLAQAIVDLNINVPIRRVDILPEGGLTIHLPHRVLTWQPAPSPPTCGGIKGGDDLTAIPGIGRVTAAKLHAAGIHTFERLRTTNYTHTLDIVGAQATKKITNYFANHYP